MGTDLKNYKPLFYACITTVVLIFFVQLACANETFTSEIYPNIYAKFYPIYASLLGWVPISIGDILYAILTLLLISSLFLSVRFILLGQNWRGIYVISRIVLWIGILYLLFHLLWGFNYYKPSLTNVYPAEDYSIEELRFMADDLLSKSVENRKKVEEDENGIFKFKRKEYAKLKPKQLNEDLIYTKIPQKAHVKYSLYSWMMRHFGVAGYFNPFSGEAQIIRKVPTTTIPFSMAHEQAHQMGYATENEANFVGYLTCVDSNQPTLQYSANFKALKYVLREIYPLDSTFVKQKLNDFSEGMQRDYQAEKAYHQKYAGKADEMFSAMNNAYLKANNQEGLQSYNRFVELLVGYYRKHNKFKGLNQD